MGALARVVGDHLIGRGGHRQGAPRMPRLPAGGLAAGGPLTARGRARPVTRRGAMAVLAVARQPHLQLLHARGQRRALQLLLLEQRIERVGIAGIEGIKLGACQAHRSSLPQGTRADQLLSKLDRNTT
jgi:hypothetical protein